jgi:hypothetical protein
MTHPIPRDLLSVRCRGYGERCLARLIEFPPLVRYKPTRFNWNDSGGGSLEGVFRISQLFPILFRLREHGSSAPRVHHPTGFPAHALTLRPKSTSASHLGDDIFTAGWRRRVNRLRYEGSARSSGLSQACRADFADRAKQVI